MNKLLAALGLMLLSVAARAADAPQVGLLELYNYYEYSPSLLSAGQPTREQFPAIAKAGVEAVINLAPVTDPGALPDEAEVVGKLGMGYVHIPVDWDKPPRADVESFLKAMHEFHGKRILVHCYAGSRASAFVYMYRVLEMKADRADARVTLEKIWANNPGYELPVVPQWKQLIDDVLAANAP